MNDHQEKLSDKLAMSLKTMDWKNFDFSCIPEKWQNRLKAMIKLEHDARHLRWYYGNGPNFTKWYESIDHIFESLDLIDTIDKGLAE